MVRLLLWARAREEEQAYAQIGDLGNGVCAEGDGVADRGGGECAGDGLFGRSAELSRSVRQPFGVARLGHPCRGARSLISSI
mgnify:CR=1 FL=1